MRTLFSALVLATLAGAATAAPGLDAFIAGDHRTPAFAERDRYRNPQATLEFFGLKPDMTVVEVWPGTGWYTEILAPYLRGRGRYYAALPVAPPRTTTWRGCSASFSRA
jgi:predicted methyltransferase